MRQDFSALRSRQRNATIDFADRPKHSDYDFRYPLRVLIDRPVLPQPGTEDVGKPIVKTSSEDRLRAAERSLVDRRLVSTKAESKLIGVAIGSPTHVPTGWAREPSPISPQHPFRNEGPLPSRSPAKGKETSLSGLRQEIQKASPLRRSPLAGVNSDPVSPMSNPADLGRVGSSAPSPSISAESLLLTSTTVSAVAATAVAAPPKANAKSLSLDLPKLEVDLPDVEFDSYSALFDDITGSSAPAVTLKKAKTVPDSKNGSSVMRQNKQANNPRAWPTRIASLQPSGRLPPNPRQPYKAVAKIVDGGDDDGSDSDSSVEGIIQQYHSLQPVTTGDTTLEKARPEIKKPAMANVSKIMDRTRHPTPRGGQQRILIDNNKPRLLPSRDTNNPQTQPRHVGQQRAQTAIMARAKPVRTHISSSAQYLSSPEREKRDDKDQAWRSSGSLQSTPSSLTSVEEDIFFDLKPYRDSNGTRASQYVVTNPDAVAVELARTMSQKNRLKQQEKGADPETENYKWTPEMLNNPWPMPPDLQAAEHFCISSDSQAVEPVLRMSMFDKAIEDVERLASASARDRPKIERRLRAQRAIARAAKHARMPSRSKGLAIGIPSPITERSRESTPRATPPPLPEEPPLVKAALSRTAETPTLSPIIIAPTLSSTFDVPPPVPKKDSKFLVTKKEPPKTTEQKQTKAANRNSKNYSHQPSSNSSRRRSRTRRDLLASKSPYDPRMTIPRSPVPRIPHDLRSISSKSASSGKQPGARLVAPRLAVPGIPPQTKPGPPTLAIPSFPYEARPGPPKSAIPDIPQEVRSAPPRLAAPGFPPPARPGPPRSAVPGVPPQARPPPPRSLVPGISQEARSTHPRSLVPGISSEARSNTPTSAAPRVPVDLKTVAARSAASRASDDRKPHTSKSGSPKTPSATWSPMPTSSVPRTVASRPSEPAATSPQSSVQSVASNEKEADQISIARTVSLTRKVSQKVFVKGQRELVSS